jgi:hypothetical protein
VGEGKDEGLRIKDEGERRRRDGGERELRIED